MKLINFTGDRPFLILEAGVNHEGSLERAFEMVDAAAEAGADAIKFQSYKAGSLASKNSPAYWDQTKEPANSQYELFQRFDAFDDEDYCALAERCQEKGITFCSTPFDNHFVDVLDPLMPFYKVASADITNVLLLEKIASKGKPVLLSVGASYLSEVDEAVRFLRQQGVQELGLLHCVLEYPTMPEHASLKTISYLKNVFPDCAIGYSDHVPPINHCQALMLAWQLGAQILEKHFTLDKSLPGNDHYHAMDPDDVKNFRSLTESALNLLGAPEKTVFDWERAARREARRSLVTTREIPEGTRITKEMLTAKRPGHGISPKHYEAVVGQIALRDLPEDKSLVWGDV